MFSLSETYDAALSSIGNHAAFCLFFFSRALKVKTIRRWTRNIYFAAKRSFPVCVVFTFSSDVSRRTSLITLYCLLRFQSAATSRERGIFSATARATLTVKERKQLKEADALCYRKQSPPNVNKRRWARGTVSLFMICLSLPFVARRGVCWDHNFDIRRIKPRKQLSRSFFRLIGRNQFQSNLITNTRASAGINQCENAIQFLPQNEQLVAAALQPSTDLQLHICRTLEILSKYSLCAQRWNQQRLHVTASS